MQNTSVALYQTLMPGISNVTLRIRYYGLYAWLLNWYARESGSTNPEDWCTFVRRAEALYALVAAHAGGQQGVAGIDWANRTLAENSHGEIDFSMGANLYLKQSWGAFGAAYGSQLVEIGLYEYGDVHATPMLTAGPGLRLADAFDAMLGDARGLFQRGVKEARISRDELEALSFMLPSAISATSEERNAYHSIVFSDGADLPVSGLARRHTLLLILQVAALLKKSPTAMDVRWTLYAGQSSTSARLPLECAELAGHRAHWWTYHANDLCHVCLEALLKFSLDRLAAFPDGTAISRLIATCIEELTEHSDATASSWGKFLQQQVLVENPFDTGNPESDWSLTRTILSGAGRDDTRICSASTAWASLRLLAVLQKRLNAQRPDVYESLPETEVDFVRSLRSEADYLKQYRESPVGEVIAGLLGERVLRRHIWVALKKLRHQGDYTFLFEQDDGRIRLRERDGPALTNPRLSSAITFLKDIHLLCATGPTPLGAEVLDLYAAL